MSTVNIEGREVPRLRPDEKDTLKRGADLLLRVGRLAPDKNQRLQDLQTMTELTAGFEGAREYHNLVFEVVLLIAAEMYGHGPEENPHPDCPVEDHEILLEALKRLRAAKRKAA